MKKLGVLSRDLVKFTAIWFNLVKRRFRWRGSSRREPLFNGVRGVVIEYRTSNIRQRLAAPSRGYARSKNNQMLLSALSGVHPCKSSR